MSHDRWHMLRGEGALTLSRRLPVRFDLAVSTQLPEARMGRIAHQVRQDIWRALRGLRGFAPAVRVERTPAGLNVTAGGQVACRFPRAEAEARLHAVLENAGNRARWLRCAR
ncbi:hypothetical protein [Roseovarius sp. ZX-A-9]|uniref:hypothetical protein n=1 Tax=Roseovarius sp. ZX-A-9 TaxID=3014783 RepID=UPI00232C258B|nr:hypothetical protein [Roseovarius sp. ZX-A-9]